MASDLHAIGPAAQAAGSLSSPGSQRTAGAEQARGSPPAHAASVTGPRGLALGYQAKVQAQVAQALAAMDRRLDAAAGLREADVVLGKIDKTLEKMQTALEGIVKRYPPYGPDAPERIELINQVIGLKKQLEALSFPPEASELAETEEVLSGQGLESSAPQKIPDEELAALLDKLETARGQIAAIRERMWADLVGVATPETEQEVVEQAGEAGAELAGSGQSIGGDSTAPVLAAVAQE